jgi:RNA polymerase subunit RPABC4/transcription elongation factor Spt4
MNTFVLLTIDGRTHIITERQRNDIASLLDSGRAKAVTIGDSLIVLHQVSGIVPMEVYQRQMKQKLAEKKMRMCRKCGLVIERSQECPCKEQPEKFPDILAVARKENPALAAALDAIAAAKSIPQITDGQ